MVKGGGGVSSSEARIREAAAKAIDASLLSQATSISYQIFVRSPLQTTTRERTSEEPEQELKWYDHREQHGPDDGKWPRIPPRRHKGEALEDVAKPVEWDAVAL